MHLHCHGVRRETLEQLPAPPKVHHRYDDVRRLALKTIDLARVRHCDVGVKFGLPELDALHAKILLGIGLEVVDDGVNDPAVLPRLALLVGPPNLVAGVPLSLLSELWMLPEVPHSLDRVNGGDPRVLAFATKQVPGLQSTALTESDRLVHPDPTTFLLNQTLSHFIINCKFISGVNVVVLPRMVRVKCECLGRSVEIVGFSMARKHSNFNERDFERALKSVKGEPDFTKKEFCEELLKHFSPDKTGKEFFSDVYVRLLDRDKKFNLKGNYGIETKRYLKGCSEYIHISTQHDGQLLIHTEKPYSYRDNRQDGAAQRRKKRMISERASSPDG